MFGDEGLKKDRGLGRVQTGSEEVDGDLQRIVGDGRGVRVIAGEGVPIGDEVKALIGGVRLKVDPILQSSKVMADVEASGGTHAT